MAELIAPRAGCPKAGCTERIGKAMRPTPMKARADGVWICPKCGSVVPGGLSR